MNESDAQNLCILYNKYFLKKLTNKQSVYWKQFHNLATLYYTETLQTMSTKQLQKVKPDTPIDCHNFVIIFYC